MAADQERADRIRQVRQDKHLRWKQIAAYVGVEMRSAQMWQETGAISWDNAVKFAELAGVDAHWLMSGAETSTPDLFAVSNGSVEDRLEQLADQLAQDRADREANVVEVKALIQAQNELLATQERILEEIRDATAKQQAAARHLEEMTQAAVDAMPVPPASRAPRKARTGTSRGS